MACPRRRAQMASGGLCCRLSSVLSSCQQEATGRIACLSVGDPVKVSHVEVRDRFDRRIGSRQRVCSVSGSKGAEAQHHCVLSRRYGMAGDLRALLRSSNRTESSLPHAEYGAYGCARSEVHSSVRIRSLFPESRQPSNGDERRTPSSHELDLAQERIA